MGNAWFCFGCGQSELHVALEDPNYSASGESDPFGFAQGRL
jgi:hypothetical protein